MIQSIVPRVIPVAAAEPVQDQSSLEHADHPQKTVMHDKVHLWAIPQPAMPS